MKTPQEKIEAAVLAQHNAIFATLCSNLAQAQGQHEAAKKYANAVMILEAATQIAEQTLYQRR